MTGLSSYIAFLEGGLWVLPAAFAGLLIWSVLWCKQIHHVEMEGDTLEISNFKTTFTRRIDEILDVQIKLRRPPSLIILFSPKENLPRKIRIIPKGGFLPSPWSSTTALKKIQTELLRAKKDHENPNETMVG